jgi:hypothetical protein
MKTYIRGIKMEELTRYRPKRTFYLTEEDLRMLLEGGKDASISWDDLTYDLRITIQKRD